MVVGKIIQFGFNSFADRRDKKRGVTALTLFLRCLTKPFLVAFFAEALFICKAFVLFGEEAISPAMADYWLYQDVNQRVNLEIMKRFEAENIEFAFPSQTLYVKKD
jgi:small-conductance mechanosensitive channel